jgi:DNA polymerase-3 subunit epsilon
MARDHAATQTLDRTAVPEKGFAVVDVETSGFHPPAAEIVGIAVVLLETDGTISGTWNSLIKPVGGVGPTTIHGITPAMVATAPRFGDIANHLHGLLNGRVIAAHNLPFDSKFLYSQFAAEGIDAPQLFKGVCTLQTARQDLQLQSYTLANCCTEVGIELAPDRGALGEAITAAKLLAHLFQLHPAQPAPDTASPALSEPAGFERFTSMYRAKLISHVRPIVGRLGAHDPEDIVQVTLTQAWITWLKQGPPNHPLAYLKQVAVRVAVKLVERESRQHSTPLNALEQVAAPDSILAAEARLDLQRALAGLPGRQRQVMLMHLQGASNREIAEQLGVAEGTVAATLHQARAKLAVAFDRRPRKEA